MIFTDKLNWFRILHQNVFLILFALKTIQDIHEYDDRNMFLKPE